MGRYNVWEFEDGTWKGGTWKHGICRYWGGSKVPDGGMEIE